MAPDSGDIAQQEAAGITAAQQTQFDNWVAGLFAQYEQEDGPKARSAEDGRLYVEITAHGAPSGVMPPILFLDLSEALKSWERNMRAYLADKTKIVWRVRPEICGQDNVFTLDVMNPDFSFFPFKPIYQTHRRYSVYACLAAS